MEPKKISFGFMKTKKVEKPLIVEEEKRDFIECLEEKAIRVVGGNIVEEKLDLIIPMKPNTVVTAERLQKIANEVEGDINNEDLQKPQIDNDNQIPIKVKNETLEQMAERELLEAARKDVKTEVAALTVPVPTNNLVGEKESTLEDYESIPVADFGMAMLRGMGWTPGQEQNKYKHPSLRPKGLGLGADKMIKDKNKSKPLKDNEEELMIVKNGFVKLVHGKFSGLYAKVISLDEENGRVLIELAMQKETVSVNECMMQAVTKTEFDQQSRILNADKYEEYKKSSEQNIQRKSSSGHSKRDEQSERDRSRSNNRSERAINDKNGKSHSNDKRSPSNRQNSPKKTDERRRYISVSSSDSEDERIKKRNKRESKERNKRRERRYRSSDSLESDLETKRKPKNSSDSESSHSDNYRKSKKNKRDIDKKRKGKKKKRDRDRSPNYRKHRK